MSLSATSLMVMPSDHECKLGQNLIIYLQQAFRGEMVYLNEQGHYSVYSF